MIKNIDYYVDRIEAVTREGTDKRIKEDVKKILVEMLRRMN